MTVPRPKPRLQRHGDAFVLTWDTDGIGFGLDHLRDTSDGLKAMLTVESVDPVQNGRIFGPVSFNLLSTRSQTEIAGVLTKRANSRSSEDWLAFVTQACAIVSAQWLAPSPKIDLREYANTGPIEYVIPGFVPKGETAFMYGDGESAKSMFALFIAMCASHGLPLPWGPVIGPMRVMYLDWETNRAMVGRRLRRLCEGAGVEMPDIDYRECIRPITDELPGLREQVSRDKIDLVIVDSIGFAITGKLVDDETARSAINALRSLTPATRLVIAHVSKDEAMNPARTSSSPFGSRFFWNGMRGGIEVKRSQEQAQDDVIDLGLFHPKMNDGPHQKPIALRLSFDGLDGPVTIERGDMEDSPDLAARTPLSQRIRTALKQKGRLSTSALADMLVVEEDRLRPTLSKMRDLVVLEPGGGRGKPTVWGLQN